MILDSFDRVKVHESELPFVWWVLNELPHGWVLEEASIRRHQRVGRKLWNAALLEFPKMLKGQGDALAFHLFLSWVFSFPPLPAWEGGDWSVLGGLMILIRWKLSNIRDLAHPSRKVHFDISLVASYSAQSWARPIQIQLLQILGPIHAAWVHSKRWKMQIKICMKGI